MKKRIVISIVWLVLFAINVFFYTKDPESANYLRNADLSYLLAALSLVLACVYSIGYFGLKSSTGISLLLITLGCLSWFVGEIIWIYFELVLAVDPFPSVADLFYLLAYPLLFSGFLREVFIKKFVWSGTQTLLNSFIALFLFGLVIYLGVFIAWDADTNFIENSVAIAYNIFNQVLIYVLLYQLYAAISREKRHFFFPWMMVFIGSSFRFIADLIFSIFTDEYVLQGVQVFMLTDLSWILGYLFFGYGIISLTLIPRAKLV